MNGSPKDGPIGVFDSGIGGLSVWRKIASQLPHEDTLYIADQQHPGENPAGRPQHRLPPPASSR